MKAHSEEICVLGNALDALLRRLEPVAECADSQSTDQRPLQPEASLCDIAQLIHKETQHIERMNSRTKDMLQRLQLPEASYPEDEPLCSR